MRSRAMLVVLGLGLGFLASSDGLLGAAAQARTGTGVRSGSASAP